MSLDIERWLRRPKIDVHCHVWNLDNEADEVTSAERLIWTGDLLGITEYWCSSPITGGRLASIEEVCAENDAVLRAMKRFPDHIRGLCFVIPGHYQHALDEIDRCLDAGMIGLKLYNQYRIDDPAVYPVLERIIERRVPLLEHAGLPTAREFLDAQPQISNGQHFAEMNRRYPEAMVIHAHIGGGGDWENTIRAMRGTSPNLVCDVAGSNLDDGQVELAVAEMGADRVLFGTDGTMTGSVGKVIDATLTDEEKDMIFWGNAKRILAAQGASPIRTGKEASA